MKISTLPLSLLAGVVPSLGRREAPGPPGCETRSAPAASSPRLQPGRPARLAEMRFPLLPPPLT